MLVLFTWYQMPPIEATYLNTFTADAEKNTATSCCVKNLIDLKNKNPQSSLINIKGKIFQQNFEIEMNNWGTANGFNLNEL